MMDKIDDPIELKEVKDLPDPEKECFAYIEIANTLKEKRKIYFKSLISDVPL
jgi:hypothetical protein